jgi:hypothetical protein
MAPCCYRCNNSTTTATSLNDDYYSYVIRVTDVGEQRRQEHLKEMHKLIHAVKVVFVEPMRTQQPTAVLFPLSVLCRWLK